MKKPTQAQKVENWLNNHKDISRQDAMFYLHINNLTAVIAEMRKKGYDIETINHTPIDGEPYATWGKGEMWNAGAENVR